MYLGVMAMIFGSVASACLGYMWATSSSAYDRGLNYALTALYRASSTGTEEATALRLMSEAGDPFESGPFDEAIMDVLGWYEAHREVRTHALWEVVDALNDMKLKGAASLEQVDTALGVVARLISESQEEPDVFCVEYLGKRDGEAYLSRRPLSDWPSWAQELRENLYGPA